MTDKNPEEQKESPVKGMGDGYSLGINLMTSVLVGTAMGYGLDKLFGTIPLFLLLFMCFGFAAGLRTIWQGLNQSNK